jgi:hypothetical protein
LAPVGLSESHYLPTLGTRRRWPGLLHPAWTAPATGFPGCVRFPHSRQRQ